MITSERPWPLDLVVHCKARRLDVTFDDGQMFSLPATLLRAMTPSVADRGHGASRDELLAGDYTDVGLLGAQAVGAYAVRLLFDDGHDTGIYTWEALYRLGLEKDRLLALLATRRQL